MIGSLLVDTHAHLDMISQDKETICSVLERARHEGVGAVLSVGIDVESSKAAVHFAREIDDVFAAVGFHPNDASRFSKDALVILKKLCQHTKVRAWGEIGLDYYRDRTPKRVQKEVFEVQLQAAFDRSLPVIIHARNALEDCIQIIKGFLKKGQLLGVFHCFSGTEADARRVLDLGFYVSFTGVVTFPKAEALRKVVRFVPIDRILIETDSPFLSPVPFRGKPNEPARVRYVAETIARIKGMDYAEVASCTTKNAKDLFVLPAP